MELAAAGIPERAERLRTLRNRLIRGVTESIPGAVLNGDPERRLPGNAHFLFPGIDGEALLLRMDLAGIAVSGGSACTTGSLEPSHVMEALGRGEREARSSLRLSLGEENTEQEIDETVQTLARIVKELRGMRSGA